MAALPGSVIVVKNGSMSDPLLRDGLIARFVEHGVAAERVRCVGKTSRHEHLAMFPRSTSRSIHSRQNGRHLDLGTAAHAACPWSPSWRWSGGAARAARSSRRSGLPDWVADDDGRLSGHRASAHAAAAGGTRRAARAPAGPGGQLRPRENCEVYTRHVEAGVTERSGATIAPGTSA